jgi:hypothetical protein
MSIIENKTPSHEAVSERAREIWIAAGRPEGQDLQHWLQAENQLRSQAVKNEIPPRSENQFRGQTGPDAPQTSVGNGSSAPASTDAGANTASRRNPAGLSGQFKQAKLLPKRTAGR